MVQCADIIFAADQCNFAKQHCTTQAVFDLYQLHYCNFEGNWGGLILLLFMLVLCYYMLGETADEYLTPSLSLIAKKLSCSESLAGVTLLALGSGSPDVISSILAVNNYDLEIAVGAQLGAGMFICTFLVGCCILSGSETNLSISSFLRDILFYYVALLLLGFTAIIGFFHISFGIIALVLYGIFMVFVMIEEKNQRKLGLTQNKNSIQLRKYSDMMIYSMINTVSEPSTPGQIILYGVEQHHFQEQEMTLFTNHAVFEERQNQIKECKVSLPSTQLSQIALSFKNIVLKNINEWKQKSLFSRIFSLVLFPLMFIIDYTMPIFDVHSWSRTKCYFSPIFILFF